MTLFIDKQQTRWVTYCKKNIVGFPWFCIPYDTHGSSNRFDNFTKLVRYTTVLTCSSLREYVTTSLTYNHAGESFRLTVKKPFQLCKRMGSCIVKLGIHIRGPFEKVCMFLQVLSWVYRLFIPLLVPYKIFLIILLIPYKWVTVEHVIIFATLC